ncbi:MAG: PTS sugar transporter subunit IIA [Longimicrobiales bacterium]|nr:PTS sugar transporter subunit IIA [Longimicrobiales bacterium]
MRLRDHLRADLVLADLEATDRLSTIDRIAEFLATREPVLSYDEVREALLLREEAHSTVMGSGLALPHATLPGLDRTLLGIAVARTPIAFGEVGDDEVRLFFVLLSPPGAQGTHIKLLARICRLVRISGVTDDLLGAHSADALVRVLLRHDEAHV